MNGVITIEVREDLLGLMRGVAAFQEKSLESWASDALHDWLKSDLEGAAQYVTEMNEKKEGK